VTLIKDRGRRTKKEERNRLFIASAILGFMKEKAKQEKGSQTKESSMLGFFLYLLLLF